MSTPMPTADAPALSAHVLPRLLPEMPLRTLAHHLDRFGPSPSRVDAEALLRDIERSGLRGHGGAGFPTAVKMRAVARGRGPRIVVANGAEGEPASTKDKTLLSVVPHLVLDGAVLAALAVGARDVILCVDRTAAAVGDIVEAAIAERTTRAIDPVRIRLERAPNRYVAGEETALVAWLNGGEAKPTFVPPRPYEKGVMRRPTLVQNVETLSHVALIARFGAQWFRGLGTEADPGSTLLTCAGGFATSGVFEVPGGVPMREVFRAARTDPSEIQAVLVGGYFGTWVPAAAIPTMRLGTESLRAHDASLGAGVLAALPHGHCGLTESAHVTRWLASQHAGQCGPCVNGLDAIARAMAALVHGDRNGNAEHHLHRWLGMVKGRGACKHPDGAARFVESSVRVFADEIDRHRRGGPCHASRAAPLLPLPTTGGWR